MHPPALSSLHVYRHEGADRFRPIDRFDEPPQGALSQINVAKGNAGRMVGILSLPFIACTKRGWNVQRGCARFALCRFLVCLNECGSRCKILDRQAGRHIHLWLELHNICTILE